MRHLPLLFLLVASGFLFTGCKSSSSASPASPVVDDGLLTRYEMANACWVLKANGNGKYLVRDGDGYAATTGSPVNAERFYLKPTALGKYLLYNIDREVLTAGEDGLGSVASIDADDGSEWRVLALGDTTAYPETPVYHQEPSAEQVSAWRAFKDPGIEAEAFTLGSVISDDNLAVAENGALATAPANDNDESQSFSFEVATGCSVFPEAQSNFSGEPFKGTRPDGTVLGHADVHVHISASEFLGGAQWGRPYHKFGIEHALPNCQAQHGPTGTLDLVGGAFTQTPQHATEGWPDFTDWPSRNNLTHEAIYWKWIERAWAGGLRIVVNDLVDNETLCELQRNAVRDPTQDCNSMNNAGRQAGTMYAMEDYIDAQYGGPGKGFFQIVHSPEEARTVIEDGKIAVVLGIEISNLFDCKLTYNPLRTKQPFEEPEDGSGLGDNNLPRENRYNCTTQETDDNGEELPHSILAQMKRVHGWGVRQIISIHEFDNAFGGNGIFDGLVLNLGNRENTGGIPSGDIASILSLFPPSQDEGAEAIGNLVANLPATETATGEWWTTYNCPVEGPVEGEGGPKKFSGYLWGDSGGSKQTTPDDFNEGYEENNPAEGQAFINILTGAACTPSGQGGRSGGKTPCYPVAVDQCNARWMTPAGLYTYGKMMEMGFLFDWDHMEVGMKTQALELAEAQDPVYPFVSTHGTFGGTTIDQATRALANGGFIYPSNGSSAGFLADMDETFGVYQQAKGKKGSDPVLFGFGYGTDTNGLSKQTEPRKNPAKPVVYPFTLFAGAPFDGLPEFAGVAPVKFAKPESVDEGGGFVRDWHQDEDGNAHYGMLSDFVQEVVLDGRPDHVRHLFNSAEAYLQTWERTEAASVAIRAKGRVEMPPPEKPILRPAPIGDMEVSPQTYR